jgi:mono/diheme cytochrome c family protein
VRKNRRVRKKMTGARRAAILGMTLLGACGGEDLTPELAEGRSLYESTCSMCHGERALGDGPMAANLPVAPPSLLLHLGHHTGPQLAGLIKSGVPPAMPPAPLDDREIQLVIDYVWSLVPEAEAASLRAMRDQMEAAERARAAPADSGAHAQPPG